VNSTKHKEIFYEYHKSNFFRKCSLLHWCRHSSEKLESHHPSRRLETQNLLHESGAAELIAYLKKHYPDGFYYIVYEACFCGFWSLRILSKAASTALSSILPIPPPSEGLPTFARWKPDESRLICHPLS
jgi:hypothetical protein